MATDDWGKIKSFPSEQFLKYIHTNHKAVTAMQRNLRHKQTRKNYNWRRKRWCKLRFVDPRWNESTQVFHPFPVPMWDDPMLGLILVDAKATARFSHSFGINRRGRFNKGVVLPLVENENGNSCRHPTYDHEVIPHVPEQRVIHILHCMRISRKSC